jgi:glycosyltransferase involved in cell wall biosynthesis
VSSSAAPRVSVGLPVYNGERYLAGALDCILAQDFGDFELIVSDNASTDGTAEIVREHAARDARIRYHRNERNLGAAPNYNRLVELARGTFFRWQTYDDRVAPTHLSRCLEAFDQGPDDLVLVYPRTTLIDADGVEIGPYEDRSEVLDPRPHRRVRHLLRALHLCNAVVGLVRLDALRRTRRIDSYRGSDVTLLAELAMLGKIAEIPERLFLRRRALELPSPSNLDGEGQAQWFDARRHGSPFLVSTLVGKHLVACLTTPRRMGDRALCAWTVAAEWLPKYWREMGGEFKIALKQSLFASRGSKSGAPRTQDSGGPSA